MPIRDFKCSACKLEWETLVSSGDAPKECPDCKSTAIAQLPALVGGYKMYSGGGSTRPRQAGSFKTKVKTE